MRVVRRRSALNVADRASVARPRDYTEHKRHLILHLIARAAIGI